MRVPESNRLQPEDPINPGHPGLLGSLLYPVLFLMVIWGAWLAGYALDLDLSRFGLLPRNMKGLAGIITSPLIHKDISHLASNSMPLLILGAGLFYFYKPVAAKVFLWVYILSGMWVWVAARSDYHIGASGLIYGFAAFLFISGIIRRSRPLLAISLLVTFFYGGLVWGVLPLKYEVSWESHLFGAIAGGVMAWYYRSEGPKPVRPEWYYEEEDGSED